MNYIQYCQSGDTIVKQYSFPIFQAMKHKFWNSEEQAPLFINLSDHHVQKVDPESDAALLANDFIETKKGTHPVETKQFYAENPNAQISDKGLTADKITTYYSIQDGQLKAGPLETFNDTDTVIPNRHKHVGKIQEIIKEGKDVRGVTINNDTVPLNMGPKYAFANEQGKAIFAAYPNDSVISLMNEALKVNPQYPILTDGGRYSWYNLLGNYKEYIKNDFPRNPSDVYIWGIRKNKKEDL